MNREGAVDIVRKIIADNGGDDYLAQNVSDLSSQVADSLYDAEYIRSAFDRNESEDLIKEELESGLSSIAIDLSEAIVRVLEMEGIISYF